MKFKSIFIIFSITLLVFLIILVFMPYYMLGSALSGSFWKIYWPLILILAMVFLSFCGFYFTNRRLFLLLEKEDWPALVRYLEDRVIQKGRYSPRLVRLLANSYFVLSDSQSVMNLENKVAIAKPSLVDANALVFGTARILGKDISGAARFFETRKETAKFPLKDWVHWYYGFSMLLNRQFEEAGKEFSVLSRISKDGVVTALSSYFLSETIATALPDKWAEFRDIALEGKEKVLKTFPQLKNWNREVSRLSSEIHAAALAKYMEETRIWVYGKTK